MVRGLILQQGHASRGSLWLIDPSLTALFGISPPFDELFPTEGQIIHALLTRSPLYSGPEGPFLVRLACVRHAASVCSEPGSNSQVLIPFRGIAPPCVTCIKRTHKSIIPLFNFQRASMKRVGIYKPTFTCCQEEISLNFIFDLSLFMGKEMTTILY